MKFFKENWFKLIKVIFILISICAFYYFFVSFQKDKQDSVLLKNQENCSKMRNNFLKNYIPSSSDDKNNFSITNHFNNKLSRCFVEVQDNSSYYNYSLSIYEPVENKILVKCVITNIDHGGTGTFNCFRTDKLNSSTNDYMPISEDQFRKDEKQYMTN